MHLEEILRRHHVDFSSLSLPEYQRGEKEHLIYLLRVPVTHVLAQWEELRTLTAETGYWPVIGWDRFKKPPREDDVVQDILEEGLHLDVHKWLAQEGALTVIDQKKKRYMKLNPLLRSSFNYTRVGSPIRRPVDPHCSCINIRLLVSSGLPFGNPQ